MRFGLVSKVENPTRFLSILLLTLGLGSCHTAAQSPSPSTLPSPADHPVSAASPIANDSSILNFDPPLEQENLTKQKALDNRLQQLGIDRDAFTQSVDELFYTKHPELNRRKLSTSVDATEVPLRDEWLAITDDLLSKLELLQSKSHHRAGTYNAHCANW